MAMQGWAVVPASLHMLHALACMGSYVAMWYMGVYMWQGLLGAMGRALLRTPSSLVKLRCMHVKNVCRNFLTREPMQQLPHGRAQGHIVMPITMLGDMHVEERLCAGFMVHTPAT